uniref:Uncharacterized protein n=1 Tax=Arundo donax TaxID=35708 RepID=A0A0A9EAT9_ARUDO
MQRRVQVTQSHRAGNQPTS